MVGMAKEQRCFACSRMIYMVWHFSWFVAWLSWELDQRREPESMVTVQKRMFVEMDRWGLKRRCCWPGVRAFMPLLSTDM